LALIQAERWSEAIMAATEVISRDPKDAEMYLHRAFALHQVGKLADAIADCTESLDIRKSDKARRLRAGLWLLLGERDIAQQDMDEMEDKRLLKATKPKESKPIGPQLRMDKRGKQSQKGDCNSNVRK
jgi:Flp pilus assembly protein TadD